MSGCWKGQSDAVLCSRRVETCRDALSCCFLPQQAERSRRADGENGCRTGGLERYVCICCSGDGQLQRGCERSWKENLGISHTITQNKSEEEHFGAGAQRKVRQGKDGDQKKSESSCLGKERWHTLNAAFQFGHNQTLNLRLQEYQRCSPQERASR